MVITYCNDHISYCWTQYNIGVPWYDRKTTTHHISLAGVLWYDISTNWYDINARWYDSNIYWYDITPRLYDIALCSYDITVNGTIWYDMFNINWRFRHKQCIDFTQKGHSWTQSFQPNANHLFLHFVGSHLQWLVHFFIAYFQSILSCSCIGLSEGWGLLDLQDVHSRVPGSSTATSSRSPAWFAACWLLSSSSMCVKWCAPLH